MALHTVGVTGAGGRLTALAAHVSMGAVPEGQPFPFQTLGQTRSAPMDVARSAPVTPKP